MKRKDIRLIMERLNRYFDILDSKYHFDIQESIDYKNTIAELDGE